MLRTPPGTFARRETVATELFRAFSGDRDGQKPSRDKPSREELLAAALLADIDAYYGPRRRFNRDLPPVILLPEYRPGGREFLDTLLRAYDIMPPRASRKRTVTRPVVVAVADEVPGERAAGPLEDLEIHLNKWRLPEEGGVRERRVLRVAATDPGSTEADAGSTEADEAGEDRGEIRSGPGRVTVMLAATAVLALAALLWGTLGQRILPGPCGTELEQVGGECVGVTDGSSGKWPGLEQVMARIEAENDRVTQGKDPYATIALMISMTSDSEDVREEILHQVQGAYLAQYRANNDEKEHDHPPRIRLVLANPGERRDHWEPVVERLAEMAGSGRDRLRVVFGFGISERHTEDAIAHLTNDRGIPVVAGSLTGDDFGNSDQDEKKFKGFARIAPNNSDQADALVAFDRDLDLRQAVLVEDRREGDDYNDSLREVFQRKLDASPHRSYPFVSEGPNTEGVLASEFRNMVVNICTLSPAVDTVYFAGRQVHLRQFVNAMAAHRPCIDREITVVSGSAASTLYSDGKLNWEAMRGDPGPGRKEVEVVYTSFSHPEAWTRKKVPDTGGSREAFDTLRAYVAKARHEPVGPVGGTDLSDSRTVSAYDSAWTAITGIRIHTQKGEVPALQTIGNDWDGLQGVYKVEGASGWICLDGAGNPYNKAVAVVRLDPLTRKPAFLGLAWPEGTPPPRPPQGTKSCQIPKEG
ncbi:hypothetical protein V1L54_27970 [Streptomyces sp. TRM 70361]|uniref:hypothetical protein n=1 Tax=Streptomyces sp. TRM 70361 TaxID=3116553 RepID=UPI002E7BA6AB|nr:hypothetical protein [Streptomyces sp. TRM 70361]MEE1943194.1 hypothetical protein [Streptomyces sp. TRM 70361]